MDGFRRDDLLSKVQQREEELQNPEASVRRKRGGESARASGVCYLNDVEFVLTLRLTKLKSANKSPRNSLSSLPEAPRRPSGRQNEIPSEEGEGRRGRMEKGRVREGRQIALCFHQNEEKRGGGGVGVALPVQAGERASSF